MEPFLIDTNVLLRFLDKNDPQHAMARSAVDELNRRGGALCVSLQNIAEFWNVCTRPSSQNGYGLSIPETDLRVQSIESNMSLLPDTEMLYPIWRRLLVEHQVRGVQVHDARLVAWMQVHSIRHILTFNRPDFIRYANVEVVAPIDLVGSR